MRRARKNEVSPQRSNSGVLETPANPTRCRVIEAALLLVGVVAGFAYMRGSGGGTSGTRGTSGTSGTSGTTKHVELTCPDHSPFEGRDRVNSLNPAVAVMFDNPMER